MIKVKISTQILNKLANSRLGLIVSNIDVEKSSNQFTALIHDTHQDLIESLQVKRENEYDVILETRKAYKLCGKEPSRYRPSAEALLRRLRTKKDLYQINNVVDSINLMSVTSRFSIGGFDMQHIQGDIFCDIGNADIYEAIGRGNLNIEFMPGLRDDLGFFGTPTSDSVRTSVTANTKTLLLVFYDFFGNESLTTALKEAQDILCTYCNAEIVHQSIIE
ncbi:MAG: phenylalanine--tRNA ligase beta subunit-related protein [Saprospiraceae bacterium]|nr:phenylalanine--tRNA ligase beta subunit-related protein [Saprospiraceae bacterium]